MSEKLEVRKLVAQRLQSADIHYIVTGSIACNFYTVPRMTRDIDIVIELEPQEARKFTSSFPKIFILTKKL